MSTATATSRAKSAALWVIAWLVCMATVYYGLERARHWALAEIGTADVQAEWQRWRAEEQVRAESNTGNVHRRAPKSNEPPLLILLRDYFPAIVISVLLIATVMFGFFAIAVPGALRSRTRPNAQDQLAEGR